MGVEERIAELKAGIADGGPREAAIRALLYIGMAGSGADERMFNTLREIRADLPVARRPFRHPASRLNGVWGRPLYFLSQMVLACSVVLV